ncbi:hypothetical protein [Rhizosphaericola mali]|uniref:3-hydroxyacyl-CoA dehydrogenase C-terminal domain-containing protein n=1 Tax=Rhizosphaericola mali TaxID=2545455 RepID=A0A5P2FYP4_9BACT|nr:hypothetical protein [Rhizosphaericola mali]QES88315.1 hypothetical protein E0W69_006425 [Rhizosphaericola mali]
MPIGSFGIIDVSGMNTIINTSKLQAKQYPDDSFFQKLIDRLQTEFVDKGKLRTSSCAGFYSYPNPKYKNLEFLKSKNDKIISINLHII